MTVEEMKKIKEERGYSMSQLSEYSGVPLGTVQKIFSGETKAPRKSTIAALEKVLLGDEAVYQGKAYTYQMESQGVSADRIRESMAYNTKFVEKKQGEYTLEDYYALPDERRVELIDGVIYDMSAPSILHQLIVGEIYGQYREYIKKNKGNCLPVISPSDVQLDRDNKTMVQPDVMIICNREKVHLFGIFGAPDFVLEVLSPSTRKKDLTIKLNKYIQAGVREYWIIDPKKKLLLVYDFKEEGMPCIYPLKGQIGLSIYDGDLKVDLDIIAEIIEDDYKEDDE